MADQGSTSNVARGYELLGQLTRTQVHLAYPSMMADMLENDPRYREVLLEVWQEWLQVLGIFSDSLKSALEEGLRPN